MKAAIFYGAHDFRVENVAEPTIGPSDILVKVKVCGICGSDLHAYKEGIFSRPGFIMGHELSGEVVEVGDNVKDIATGERVIPMVSRISPPYPLASVFFRTMINFTRGFLWCGPSPEGDC